MLPFHELALVLFTSVIVLFIFRKLGKAIHLVDIPNNRKLHLGKVPLVGGLSIWITIFLYLLFNSALIPNSTLYLSSITVLVIVGALDDRFDISYHFRLLVQAMISISLIVISDLELLNLGNILGTGDVKLAPWGNIVTVLAIIAAINAFNMVDGIDGLLGGLSIVTFSGLGVLLWFDSQLNIAYFCFLFVAALIPYVIFNLGILGKKRKVFMGDAGSTMIGFTVVWLMLQSSQSGVGVSPPLRPVTALWLIAIPLMDMVCIMIRRLRRGDSPFKPDREHLHHICQRLGYNSKKTLMIICSASLLFATVGIVSELYSVPEYVMFYSFIFCFIAYFLVLNNIWKIVNLP